VKDTHQFVRRLASDLQPAPAGGPSPARLAVLVGAGSIVSLAAVLAFFSRTPHLAHGPTTTILFTALAGVSLAAVAYYGVSTLSYPEAEFQSLWLLLPLGIFAAGLSFEMMQVPSAAWPARLWGDNPLACFTCVALLSLPILGGALIALRSGAPTHPYLAGAMAGLLAGGIAAALYTLHCPENSLLFIGAWHIPAIVLVAVIGGVAGGRLLRW